LSDSLNVGASQQAQQRGREQLTLKVGERTLWNVDFLLLLKKGRFHQSHVAYRTWRVNGCIRLMNRAEPRKLRAWTRKRINDLLPSEGNRTLGIRPIPT